jgi:hypothetical protein
VQQFGLGEQDETLIGFEAAKHEIGIVVVDEVPLVHEPDRFEDGAFEENAARGGVLDAARRGKLAHVFNSILQVIAAIAQEWLEPPSGCPDYVRTVEVVHDGGGHRARVCVDAVDQPGEELGAKFNIIVEQQDVLAACVEGCMDALVVTCRDAEVGWIRNNCEAVALGAALRDGVVG